jgi:hypothetical protein
MLGHGLGGSRKDRNQGLANSLRPVWRVGSVVGNLAKFDPGMRPPILPLRPTVAVHPIYPDGSPPFLPWLKNDKVIGVADEHTPEEIRS